MGKHDAEALKNPIIELENDIKNRIREECKRLKKADHPRKEIDEYARNIRWHSPELAAYVKRQMLLTLDLDNR